MKIARDAICDPENSPAFTTAQRAIERLERAGIVKRVGDAKRDRVYCAGALLEILEEPAHVTPGMKS